MTDEYFISPTKGKRDFENIIDDVIEFVEEDNRHKYDIVVGTDSEQFTAEDGRAKAQFVSVVAVHRVGRHGRYFYKRLVGIPTYDHHDRMLKEATYSLELAQRVVNGLRPRLNDLLYNFEIHLDIGHNGPTNGMIAEIVGMITGSGFTARIKPESYAANKVADRHVG